MEGTFMKWNGYKLCVSVIFNPGIQDSSPIYFHKFKPLVSF